MGKKDVALHRYFQDEERFADLLNGYIFAGRQVVQGSDVLEKDSRISGMFGRIRRRFPVQKYRDLIRRVVLDTDFVIVGLEHQDQVHYGMPVRVMVQDAVNYEEQFRRIQKRNRHRADLRSAEWMGRFSRTDRLDPVVTIVLYYGRERWDGPRDLRHMMDLGEMHEELARLVNSYPIHILEVRTFEQTEQLRTDLQDVFRFIQCAEDKTAMKELTEQASDRFRAMEEDTFDVIAALTGTRELETVKEVCTEEGGRIDMCRAIKELIAEGRSEGILAGRSEGILVGRSEGILVGRNEGILEGRSEGARSKAEIVARNMFLRGISAEDAAAICEEDIEQVRSWYRSWGR